MLSINAVSGEKKNNVCGDNNNNVNDANRIDSRILSTVFTAIQRVPIAKQNLSKKQQQQQHGNLNGLNEAATTSRRDKSMRLPMHGAHVYFYIQTKIN